MTPTDQWISKTEAGLRLGVSGRRIHDLANTGRLQSCQVRDPETGHMAIRIHAGSVERYIFERDNEATAHFSPSNEEPKSAAVRTPAPGDLDQVIRYLATIARPALSPPSPRLWLTVTESAAYSGLPVTVITDFVKQGKLEALNVGRRRRGGQWRIRRVDLEQFDPRSERRAL